MTDVGVFKTLSFMHLFKESSVTSGYLNICFNAIFYILPLFVVHFKYRLTYTKTRIHPTEQRWKLSFVWDRKNVWDNKHKSWKINCLGSYGTFIAKTGINCFVQPNTTVTCRYHISAIALLRVLYHSFSFICSTFSRWFLLSLVLCV